MPFLDKLQRKSLDIVVFTHFSDIEANEQLLHFENIKIWQIHKKFTVKNWTFWKYWQNEKIHSMFAVKKNKVQQTTCEQMKFNTQNFAAENKLLPELSYQLSTFHHSTSTVFNISPFNIYSCFYSFQHFIILHIQFSTFQHFTPTVVSIASFYVYSFQHFIILVYSLIAQPSKVSSWIWKVFIKTCTQNFVW